MCIMVQKNKIESKIERVGLFLLCFVPVSVAEIVENTNVVQSPHKWHTQPDDAVKNVLKGS